MKSEITVTMPMHEYESIQDDREFWQNRFNELYRIVRRYYKQGVSGKFVINESVTDDNARGLAKELALWLDTWYDRV